MASSKVESLAEGAALVGDGNQLLLSGLVIWRKAVALPPEAIRLGLRAVAFLQAVVELDVDPLAGVMVLQAQMADEEGNPRVLGPLWVSKEAARAALSVIVVAEEVVPTETIRQQPELALVPGFRVAAVVPLAYGAHPTALYRC